MSTFWCGNSIEELQDTRIWNQRTGYQRIRHFKGTIDKLLTLAENTKAAKLAGDPTEIYFLEYNISQPNEQAYCTMDMVYQIDLLENWYIDGAGQLQSIWLKPSVVTFSNTVTEANLAIWHEAFDGGVEKHMSNSTMKGAYPLYYQFYINVTTQQQTLLDGLYNSLLKGNDNFYIDNTLLRRENIIPNVTDILVLNLSIGYVNKLFTPAMLLATWPSLPQSYQSILYSTGYWFYRNPSITQQTNNKLFCRQEWEYTEAYNSFVYQLAY